MVVLVVASAMWRSSRVERVVGGDVVADMPPLAETAESRGRDAGVAERTSGAAVRHTTWGSSAGTGSPGGWSNAMLQWQRTGCHFQPRNWMNGTCVGA